MSKEQVNPFDEMSGYDPDAAEKQQKEWEEKGNRLDYLIHQVFSQNEEGVELYSIWRESLMMAPTAEPGMGKVEIGIREGMKTFIRKIGLTIKKVEGT